MPFSMRLHAHADPTAVNSAGARSRDLIGRAQTGTGKTAGFTFRISQPDRAPITATRVAGSPVRVLSDSDGELGRSRGKLPQYAIHAAGVVPI